MNAELRWMGAGDRSAIVAAGHLYDAAVQPEWTDAFLAAGGHHLCIVPVDHDNEAALATYRSTSPDEESPARIIWWDLGG